MTQTITRLSFSGLNNYSNCGERFRLEKVEQAPSEPSWAQVAGSSVHTATEAYDRHQLGQTPPPRGFSRYFEEEIEKQEAASGVLSSEWRAAGRSSKAWPDKENRDWWEHHGPGMLSSYYAWRAAAPWQIWITPAGEPAIELEINATIGGIMVKMFIDRVEQSMLDSDLLAVNDIKSGRSMPVTPDQLATYALGVEKTLGVFPQLGFYYDARNGCSTSAKDLTHYRDGVLAGRYAAAMRGIQAGVFLPNPGPLCGSCGVGKFCAAVGGERANEFPPVSVLDSDHEGVAA